MLWLLPAEEAAQEARRGPTQQARRRPLRALAERAFAAPAVVLVREALVAAPAQQDTAPPCPHGTSFRVRKGPAADSAGPSPAR